MNVFKRQNKLFLLGAGVFFIKVFPLLCSAKMFFFLFNTRYDKEGCSYLYDIDAHIDVGRRKRSKPFVIDATKYGNVARFINHR